MDLECITIGEKKCVFCQQCFETGEKCVAALGTTYFAGITDTFEVPAPWWLQQQRTKVYFGYENEAQEALLCHAQNHQCNSSFNSFLAHKGCIPSGITCKTFWDIGHAITPWFPSLRRDLHFRPTKDVLRSYIDSGLANLPEELFRTILWDHAPRSGLSKLGVALQFDANLIKRLERSLGPPLEFDLADPALTTFGFDFLGIQYRPFFKSMPITDTSTIRLAVDYLGIRNVEILSGYPDMATCWSQKGLWYIVERFHKARENLRLISNGPFVRFKDNCNEFRMWDIDSPPERGSYSSAGEFSQSPCRIRSINLSKVVALTVFCDKESIFGIHGHLAKETATTTYSNLHYTTQEKCIWRYFPLQQGERIVYAWVYKAQDSTHRVNLGVVTSYGRASYFGAFGNTRDFPSSAICNSPMEYLFYEEPLLGETISWFGATPKVSKILVEPAQCPTAGHNLIKTHAELTDVKQVEYYSDEIGATTGILFMYSSGHVESIGQRQVGLPTTTVTRVECPKWIHISRNLIRGQDRQGLNFTRRYVICRFKSTESEFCDEANGWRKFPMEGKVCWTVKLNWDFIQFYSPK